MPNEDLNLSNPYSGLISQFNPGNSPYGSMYGPGLMDVYNYEKSLAQQREAKGLALNQAKIQGDIQQNMIKEYNMGAPGREGMIGFNNELGKQMGGNAKELAKAKLLTELAKGGKASEELRKGFNAQGDEAAIAVYMASRQGDANLVTNTLKQIKTLNPDLMVGGTPIKNIPDDQLEVVMSARGFQVLMDKKVSGGLIMEDKKIGGRLANTVVAGEYSLKNTMARIASAESMQKAKQLAASQNKGEIKKFEESLVKDLERIREDEDSTPEIIAKAEARVAQLLGAVKAVAPVAAVEAKAEGNLKVLQGIRDKRGSTGGGSSSGWGAAKEKK